MLVALERFDLRIRNVRSLKQKRHVLRALTNGIRTTFQASVAEVEHHDLWQRAAIAVALVGPQEHHLRRVMHEIEKFIDRRPEVEVIAAQLTVHYPDD